MFEHESKKGAHSSTLVVFQSFQEVLSYFSTAERFPNLRRILPTQ